MNKFILLFLLTFSLSLSNQKGFAQGDITLTTQAQVDAFNSFLYFGDITIDGNNITNLNSLTNLMILGGNLNIQNTNITNLSGLENIAFAESVQLKNNSSLNSLMNLGATGNNVSTINNFTIDNCDALVDFTGVNNLSLQNLYIRNNANLISFDGNTITTITNDVQIEHNPSLQTLDHLALANTLETVRLINCPQLTDISVFSSVSTINDDLAITFCSGITNLGAFSNLTSLSSTLSLVGNQGITSLSGIDNIDPTLLTNFVIVGNSSLSICHYPTICTILNTGTINSLVQNNAPGDCFNKTNLQNACLAPLPVELLYFKGELTAKEYVNLEWVTSTEINNDYFEVQHSTNGKNYRTLTTINGNGTTQEETYYTHIHQTPSRGVNFYRLKQFDYDGQFTVHDEVRVYIQSTDVVLAPNPVIDVLSISTTSPTEVTIVNQNGQIVFTTFLATSDVIDLQHLPANIYFVQLKQGNTITTEKLVKLK